METVIALRGAHLRRGGLGVEPGRRWNRFPTKALRRRGPHRGHSPLVSRCACRTHIATRAFVKLLTTTSEAPTMLETFPDGEQPA